MWWKEQRLKEWNCHVLYPDMNPVLIPLLPQLLPIFHQENLGLFSWCLEKSSSWPEADSPIWRPFGPFLAKGILRRRRLNHFPHDLYICIFPTRLHVLIKTKKSISLACSQHHKQTRCKVNLFTSCKSESLMVYVDGFMQHISQFGHQ